MQKLSSGEERINQMELTSGTSEPREEEVHARIKENNIFYGVINAKNYFLLF
jgi:hypothetical protein